MAIIMATIEKAHVEHRGGSRAEAGAEVVTAAEAKAKSGISRVPSTGTNAIRSILAVYTPSNLDPSRSLVVLESGFRSTSRMISLLAFVLIVPINSLIAVSEPTMSRPLIFNITSFIFMPAFSAGEDDVEVVVTLRPG